MSVSWLIKRNPRGLTSAAQDGLAGMRGLEGHPAPLVYVGMGKTCVGACIWKCRHLWLLAYLLCGALCLGKEGWSRERTEKGLAELCQKIPLLQDSCSPVGAQHLAEEGSFLSLPFNCLPSVGVRRRYFISSLVAVMSIYDSSTCGNSEEKRLLWSCQELVEVGAISVGH